MLKKRESVLFSCRIIVVHSKCLLEKGTLLHIGCQPLPVLQTNTNHSHKILCLFCLDIYSLISFYWMCICQTILDALLSLCNQFLVKNKSFSITATSLIFSHHLHPCRSGCAKYIAAKMKWHQECNISKAFNFSVVPWNSDHAYVDVRDKPKQEMCLMLFKNL